MLNNKTHKLVEQIRDLSKAKYTGTLKITRAQNKILETINIGPKTSFFILDQGVITYADSTVNTPQSLAQKIGKKFKINLIDRALNTAKDKVANEHSFQELFDLLARFGIIKWEEITEYIQYNIVTTIEEIENSLGTVEEYHDFYFDLQKDKTGLSWQEIKEKLKLRQQKWHQLAAKIPHREVIPQIVPGITLENDAKQHCQQWVNGKRSLLEIAEQSDQDALELAIQYHNWIQRGWISFVDTELSLPFLATNVSSETSKLPIILSVDDSLVVQTMIKRAIGEHYQVIVANNGLNALQILTSSPKIKLVLLDVTMPDVDGLEICQTIRRFKHFKDLPIIMLTAKDRMLDKFKGKFAGSNEYLTKPVDKIKLLETIQKYVPAPISVSS